MFPHASAPCRSAARSTDRNENRSDAHNQMKLGILLILIVSIQIEGSPSWSIETIFGDIIIAEKENHKIFEVKILSSVPRKRDTVRTDKNILLDPLRGGSHNLDTGDLKEYVVEVEILSSILNDDYSNKIPLIAIDRRPIAKWFWAKFKKVDSDRYVIILEPNGIVLALYSLKFIESGNKKIDRKKKQYIADEINILLNDQKYDMIINKSNLEKMLKRVGIKI